MAEVDGQESVFGGIKDAHRVKTLNLAPKACTHDDNGNGMDGKTADDMDSARQQNMAYEYLCHLEEAKKWIEGCVEEELGSTVELEEALRDGIYLAKLGHYFAPEIVPARKIYDADRSRLAKRGLHFKHTDNINFWMQAMASIGLPQIFFPTTPDLYDRKNMPKVVYCIHALSIWLNKLGKAPTIENLLGIAEFTEEEITEMGRALEQYGISIPAFNKIGGILEKELGVDEAAKHAAVIAINEILLKEDADVTLEALNNKKAYLNYIEPANKIRYQDILYLAKLDKTESAQDEGKTSEDSDIYEFFLTHEEIQDVIDDINDIVRKEIAEAKYRKALKDILGNIDGGSPDELTESLKNSVTRLKEVDSSNAALYQDFLKAAKASRENGALSYDEIQEIVNLANDEMKIRRDLDGALRALNAAVASSDVEKTYTALEHPAFKLPPVSKPAAPKYQATLFFERANKINALNKKEVANTPVTEEDMEISLNSSQIQEVLVFEDDHLLLLLPDVIECIKSVNEQVKLCRKFAEAIANINGCLVQDDPAETLSALSVQAAGITEIMERCAIDYHQWLKEGVEVKREQGESSSGDSNWLEMRSLDGMIFFYNLENKSLVWVKPADYCESSYFMAHDEIQWVISKLNAKTVRDEHFEENMDRIVRLQSFVRMKITRNKFKARLNFLNENEEAALRIQCLWRGYTVRKEFNDRLDYLKKQEKHVIRIQSWVRGCQTRKNYLQLSQEKPPVQVLFKFLYLLDQSMLDIAEEAELAKHKANIVKEIRHNQQLEQEMNEMDIKIGLLVKNRLSLQDVVSHSKKLKKGEDTEKKQGGLKALSKENREMLESYQHLFYLLQTNPRYLAKLLFCMPQNNATKFMEAVILTVYNYGTNTREECLLLRLFRNALIEEVQLKVDKIQDISTGNPTVIKIVVTYYRGAQGNQNSLKTLLGPLIQQVMDDKELNMNIHPVDVYKSWISKTESETGTQSTLPYDVTAEQALKHSEVTDEIDRTIKKLVTIIESFQDEIIQSVDKMPYGIRYIAMCLRRVLKEKFPSASNEEILKAVGNLLYYRYMNPVITAPEAFEIVELDVGSNLSNVQRRNLGSIAKILQHAASHKTFDSDAKYLNRLDEFIEVAHIKFMEFFDAASDVSEIEEHFHMDAFSDVTMLNKPVIFISPKEIASTHQLLVEHKKEILQNESDPMHEVLATLGPVPEDGQLLGTDDKTTEFSLHLTNKWELNMSDESNIQALFSKTKYLVVDLLKIQKGETLTAILHSEANKQQQELYSAIHRRRQGALDASTEETQGGNKTYVFDPNDTTLNKLKQHIIKNLQILEEHKLVTSTEDYQEILTSIARDITNQRKYRLRRKQDLKKLSNTMEDMNKKRKYFSEAVTYYQEYVKACINNLSKAKYAKNDKKKTAKYSAQKLYEKGILVEIDNVPPSSFKAVTIEFSTTGEVGEFEVSGKLAGYNIDKVNVVFENLLQLQYEGVSTLKFDGCGVVVNVNLLIFLINKKFYGVE